MRRLAVALGLMLLISDPAEIYAEQTEKCRIIRVEGAAFLAKCGTSLRSFALLMENTKRTPERTATDKFRFTCPPGLCPNEPDISGWFIAPNAWRRSKRDEPAIFDLLAAGAGWKMLKSEEYWRGVFKPSCEISDVAIAGLTGRSICYSFRGDKGDDAEEVVIVAVVADADAGFLISFQMSKTSLSNLQTQAASAIRTFRLERGKGDATLERWIR